VLASVAAQKAADRTVRQAYADYLPMLGLTVRRARSEVRTAYDEVAIVDVALGQAEQSAKFAAKALALATAAYRGGATNNLDVIDAERRARLRDAFRRLRRTRPERRGWICWQPRGSFLEPRAHCGAPEGSGVR
jgi:hypothetical protein